MRATITLLEEKYGARGREAFGQIAVLSGAGSLGSAGIGEQEGGIDLTGYEANEAIPLENREKITQILAGKLFDDEKPRGTKKVGEANKEGEQ